MTLKEKLFALLRVESCGAKLPPGLTANLAIEDFEKLYAFSKSHDLAHLVGDALLQHNLLPQDKEIYKKFIEQRRMAVYRREQIDFEQKCVCDVLTKTKIQYIPLKGAVLNKYYAESWMRTSCDIDIFVKEEDLERATKAICDNLQYSVKGKSPHDMQLYAENGIHLELHYTLIEDYRFPLMAKVLSQIWDYTIEQEDNAFCFYNTLEFFIFYHMAHTAKHFISGGCGIRPFLDLWIMGQKMPFDKGKLRELLQRGGLLSFYEHSCQMAEYWFGEAEPSEIVREMEEYVLRGGVYGTIKNKIAVNREKPKNKFKFIFSSLFLTYEHLCQIYPSLKGRRWLKPFYQIRRWLRLVFRGASKSAHATVRAYDSVSEEEKQRVKNLLKELGLFITDGKGF